MPAELFGPLTSDKRPTRSAIPTWSTVPLSILAHLAVFVALLIIPLMAAGELPLPAPLHAVAYTRITPVVPPEPVAVVRAMAPRAPSPDRAPDAAPIEMPRTIDPEPALTGLPQPSAGLGPTFPFPAGPRPFEPDPRESPPPRTRASASPVRAGVGVREPRRLTYAPPVYPEIARVARVEGTVVLEAVLTRDGRVESIRVLRSLPLLDGAAIDAVRRWTYSPTLLNGQPVPVLMTISVTFTLR